MQTYKRAELVRAAEHTRWLTLAEVSELTHLPVRSLRYYVETGRLRGYRPVGSKAVRIKATDIERLFTQIQPKTIAGRGE